MEAMRESWTDDRLDDLNGKVDALRLEMKAEFSTIRGDSKTEFAAVRSEMKAGFDRVDDRFLQMDERFDGLQRTLLQMAGATIATLIAGFAGIIATQL